MNSLYDRGVCICARSTEGAKSGGDTFKAYSATLYCRVDLRFDLVRRAQEISVRRVQLPRYPETMQSTVLRVEDYHVSSHPRVLDVDLSLVNDNLSWRDSSTKVE